ncbi:MAG TPA: hypothetical protein VGK29_22825 [Paludibaculum sp.]
MKQAEALQKRMRQKRWPDASSARCEQSIMLGFYSIRKLTESGKLTDDVANMSVRVRSHSSKGRVIHQMNSHKLDELYDLDTPDERTVPLPFLCNQIVHSYVFGLLLGEDGGLQGILVTSDRRRSKELLEISIEEIIGVFACVGNDDVCLMEGRFDEAKGDYVFSRKKT